MCSSDLDELGQHTNGLTEIATVWGSLYPVRGQEFYEVQKIQGRVTHKCYVRYRSALENLDSNAYLSCAGRVYSIESVTNLELENKFMEIYCTEHINKEEVPQWLTL